MAYASLLDGPMARFAGKLIVRLIPPRVVVMMWWEYLMLVAGAWFACVVGIAYFHGILLDDYPAVLLTPFIPSMIALMARLRFTLPLNPLDGPRFVLNVLHILAVPLSFILLFLKMWNDLGSIPWWIVAVLPAGVLTRAVIEQLWLVVMEMPNTEYDQLGYGREGSAFEYAFSEPQDDDVEIVAVRPSSSIGASKRSPKTVGPKQKAPKNLSTSARSSSGGVRGDVGGGRSGAASVDNAV